MKYRIFKTLTDKLITSKYEKFFTTFKLLALKMFYKNDRKIMINNMLWNFGDSKMFFIIYDEIFNKKVYDIILNNDKPFIIDIGANIGLTIKRFYELYPNATIIGIEPQSETFKILLKNILNNKLFNTIILPYAITDKNGSAKLYYDEKITASGANSLIEGANIQFEGNIRNEEIETRKLSDIILNKHIDLLKMDCEGSEIQIINDLANNDKFKNIDNLIIEYHEYEGKCDNLIQILNILHKNNYNIRLNTTINYPIKNEKLNIGLIYATKII